MEEIREHIATLSRHEKLALIRDITVLLEEETGLSPADEAQVSEELAAYERDGDVGEEWPAVRAHRGGNAHRVIGDCAIGVQGRGMKRRLSLRLAAQV